MKKVLVCSLENRTCMHSSALFIHQHTYFAFVSCQPLNGELLVLMKKVRWLLICSFAGFNISFEHDILLNRKKKNLNSHTDTKFFFFVNNSRVSHRGYAI